MEFVQKAANTKHLKLVYFDFKGRAEPIRLALHMGGIAFEDCRISRQDFIAMKPDLPSGQMPVLEIDGFQLSQSDAILRYAGKLAGLYPEDPVEAAKCDAHMGLAEDILSKIVPSIREPDETKKMEMRAKLANEVLPVWLGFLQTALEGCGDFFGFGGKSPNIADLLVLQVLDWISGGILDGIPATILDGFPLLKAHLDRMNAMPKIAEYYARRRKMKLIYFNIKGRAEPIRLAFYLGGVKFEDCRIAREEFQAMKPGLPSGQIPILEVDGYQLSQSIAILRYAGKLAGLYPEDSLEAAKCDSFLDLVEDILSKVVPTMREPDQAKKMEMRAKLASEVLPVWLGFLQTALEGCGDFFGGSSINIADLSAYQLADMFTDGFFDGIPTTLLDGFPLLKAHQERMNAVPKIAEYYASRS